MSLERTAALSRGRAASFTAAVLILASAPAMALHYALNFAATGLAPAVQMLVLTLDSLLVGAMAILIGNATWISYRDAQKLSPERPNA